nr:hypothetical protein [Tanacetum cinerariifolium]
MATMIKQQVALDEALFPRTQRIPDQSFAELPFEEEILEFFRNTKAYKEYYACATGEATPKPKASARKKKGGSASSITPPTPIATPTPTTTVVAAPRQSAAANDEGIGSRPGVLDVPSDDLEKEISWNSSDDEDVDDQTKVSDDKEGEKTDESDDDDDDQEETEKVNDDDDDEEEISKIGEQEATESDDALDEALVPSAQRLRIGRSNFRLPSDIQSKESTLQVPWRSFAVVINKCLTGKSSGFDSLRLSQVQILWGLYHKRNIDYAFLIWEDLVYQLEHKNQKKSNEMYYPRFTKVIIHHFMTKNPSIPRRNIVNWHYVRDDILFSTIKVVSRHQNTQQYGAILPIELTTEDIRNTKAYKEYYACATGEATPKPKASARKKKRLSAAAKGKQPARATSHTDPSDVEQTEAEQLKIVLSKSRHETHISQQGGSSIDEGTGSIPGVPDVPSDDSEEEISWNSFDDEDEGPSAGLDRGSKRRREGGEHASASTPSEQATGSACRSTTGTQSSQLSVSESVFVEESVQTTCQMEEPSHLVFETGAEDQPLVQTSQHPEWFPSQRDHQHQIVIGTKLCQLLKEMLS